MEKKKSNGIKGSVSSFLTSSGFTVIGIEPRALQQTPYSIALH